MKEKFKFLPQNERKKIMLICDDIRVHSGVATVAREIVINTAHHFNWVNIAGAINHPEKGKRFDISADTNTNAGITDASIFLYPVDGYGDPDLIRQLIELEKPDALMLIKMADDVVLVLVAHLDEHPVADGGQGGVVRGVVPDLSGQHEVDFLAAFNERAEVDRGLADQAGGHPVLVGERRAGLFKVIGPAELEQGHGRTIGVKTKRPGIPKDAGPWVKGQAGSGLQISARWSSTSRVSWVQRRSALRERSTRPTMAASSSL